MTRRTAPPMTSPQNAPLPTGYPHAFIAASLSSAAPKSLSAIRNSASTDVVERQRAHELFRFDRRVAAASARRRDYRHLRPRSGRGLLHFGIYITRWGDHSAR